MPVHHADCLALLIRIDDVCARWRAGALHVRAVNDAVMRTRRSRDASLRRANRRRTKEA